MIRAVFDCGVLVSAIGWPGNPRACLGLVAHRQVRLCATADVWNEYDERIPEIIRAVRPNLSPRATLDWLLTVLYFVEPAPLGKPRSRDPKDDRYLACALGAKAEAVVSNDRDLLALERPFGVAMLTPVELLKLVRGRLEP